MEKPTSSAYFKELLENINQEDEFFEELVKEVEKDRENQTHYLSRADRRHRGSRVDRSTLQDVSRGRRT